MKVREVLKFINPPGSYHSPSLFLLRLLAEHGPPVDGKILGGEANARAITIHEMRLILDVYQEETEKIILTTGAKENIRGPFEHPSDAQVLHLLQRFLPLLPRSRKSYKSGMQLTEKSTICFEDLSHMVELFYPDLVKACLRRSKP